LNTLVHNTLLDAWMEDAMPEATISTGGGSIGTVSIDPMQVDADGGPDFPFLRITTKVALAPVESRSGAPINEPASLHRHYTIMQVSGRVQFQAEGAALITIGRFVYGASLLRTDSGSQAFNIEVELNPYRVRRIEAQRHGDAVFQVELTWLLARHPEVPRGRTDPAVDGLDSTWTSLSQIRVPQSHWATLLPKLGYGSVQIIELPTAAQIVPGLQRSLDELAGAQADVALGKYDDAVGHCRNALQNVADVLPYPPQPNGRPPTFRMKVDHFIEQMGGLLAEEKQAGLKQIMNAMWQWTSAAEHPHMEGLFNRADAESLMLITTAVLSYAGRLLEASKTGAGG
jgi:hypothetical protein